MRRWLGGLTLLAAACACSRSNRKPEGPIIKVFGSDDAGPALAAPDAGAPPAPVGVKGSLTYQGTAYALERPLLIEANHCHEADIGAASVSISLPAADSPYKTLPLKLVEISGDASKLKLGDKLEPQTADRSFQPGQDDRARVLAWISDAGRGGEATLPKQAWVRFDALSKTGPIDVSFDLDFGDLGHAAGRIVLPSSAETVCKSPAPPPPPPPG